MAQSTINSSLPIEFLSDTFPVIGSADQHLEKIIREERRISASDLWETHLRLSISFEDPYPWGDRGPSSDKELTPEKVTIRREARYLVLEAHGITTQSDRETHSLKTIGSSVIAKEQILLGPLLRIMQDYVNHNTDAHEAVAAFNDAGNHNGIVSLDEARKRLHIDMSRALHKQLEGKSIRFAMKSPDDPSSDGDDAETALRYLSVAVMLHTLPARVFQETVFLEKQVVPKFDSRDSKRESGGLDGNNPFVRPD